MTSKKPNQKILRVGLVQQACSDNREQTVQATIAGIREAAARGAQLVLLQELHTSLYFCQHESTDLFDLAEPIPGPSTEQFGALAKELGIVLVISLFERRAAGLYHNTAVVLERDGSIAGIYRKMHIPDDPGYYEKFYFTPGDLGFQPIETSVGKLGLLVCWDQWYPEAARMMALAGADLLLYPTAIGWNPVDDAAEQARQRDAWITIQRAHAVANGLPVLVANRVGFEADPSTQTQGSQFWGHSFVAGPQGEFIATADESAQVLVADVDLARSENVRRWWPFLRDRRIEAYGDLTKRYRD
ncbi:carbon-nitrogen hydrolase [Microbulbifer rhizosphaerae]|uniref:N-carbamoylputrescine amidase n=1 Tax=Microbulbifer rhizosphaerae TaxID=1562603 RepID=A0A7W4WE55_9GAMM|nr:carbon-nitrogen hydrolase [Microbulbifer rhizosphaerae]MBB3062047.1 N-carbamoylputrescine amidase [Microbulbifer rhizosphaerae]